MIELTRKTIDQNWDRNGVWTVLLHATLEDVLRELLRYELPKAGPQILKQYRLTLADLHALRAKKRNDVFRTVIGRSLDRRSFNGSDDLCETLNQLGLKSSDYRDAIANVLPMIARRHKIVHQGDRGPGEDVGDHGKTIAISDSDVITWANAVDTFVRKVIHEMQIKAMSPTSK